MKPRVCIYGTGAIGGLLAARLSQTGAEVSCIARGSQLKLIRDNGLLLIENNNELLSHPTATDDPSTLDIQDIVFITLKTHALADNAIGIARLVGPQTTIVTAHNGLPWWYFYRDKSAFPRQHLESVDPDGLLWGKLGPERTLGSIVYPAATVPKPGVIQHISGNRFTLGEPSGELSPRLESVSKLLEQAGFEVGQTGDIRSEVWLKLAVNAAINPLSLIHRATVGDILADPGKRALLATLITEAQLVARALGVEPLMSPTDLVEVLKVVKGHKTSMLVDYEQKRPLELESLTGAVVEIARRMSIPAPALDALYRDVNQLHSTA